MKWLAEIGISAAGVAVSCTLWLLTVAGYAGIALYGVAFGWALASPDTFGESINQPITLRQAQDAQSGLCCVDDVQICWGEDDEPGDVIVIRHSELCEDDAYRGRRLDIVLSVDCTGD